MEILILVQLLKTVQAISIGDRKIEIQFHFEATMLGNCPDRERFKNIFRNFIRAGKQYHEVVKSSQGDSSLLCKNLKVIKDLNQSVLSRISKCANKSQLFPESADIEVPSSEPKSLYEIPMDLWEDVNLCSDNIVKSLNSY